MKVKIETNFKDFHLTVERDCNTSGERAGAVHEMNYLIENMMETFGSPEEKIVASKVDELPTEDYNNVTDGQKTYLKKLGMSEAEIEKIKTKADASALITKLQSKKG